MIKKISISILIGLCLGLIARAWYNYRSGYKYRESGIWSRDNGDGTSDWHVEAKDGTVIEYTMGGVK